MQSLLSAVLTPALARRIGVRRARLWRNRAAIVMGAVTIGFVALGFAAAGDRAQHVFEAMVARWWFAPLLATPALFVLFAWLTRAIAPAARGSGIPQVIAATHAPDTPHSAEMLSLRTAALKLVLTVGALLGGASVGREGPTVQLGAAVMVQVQKLVGARITSGLLIAGGAAGVAAAFNTPVAGIMFAIEELASAYEQRLAVQVMGTVVIAGLTAKGVAGDYVYFGTMGLPLPLVTVLLAAPIAGIVGGMLGGLFARGLLAVTAWRREGRGPIMRRPLLLAGVCGLVVAALGIATHGATWGTGYAPARVLLGGGPGSIWLGPAKFAATLATSASGLPGGIFAPSLAVGAGFGHWLALLFPHDPAGAIVLLGMAGYFTGVVRAPLTGVIILSETTGSGNAILPLFATALIADAAGAWVCRERLYHALARDFMHKPRTEPSLAGPPAQ